MAQSAQARRLELLPSAHCSSFRLIVRPAGTTAQPRTVAGTLAPCDGVQCSAACGGSSNDVCFSCLMSRLWGGGDAPWRGAKFVQVVDGMVSCVPSGGIHASTNECTSGGHAWAGSVSAVHWQPLAAPFLCAPVLLACVCCCWALPNTTTSVRQSACMPQIEGLDCPSGVRDVSSPQITCSIT